MEGQYTGTYIGKEVCGFKKDHEYIFEVNNNSRTYELIAIYDKTLEETVDIFIMYSNENSIRLNWRIDE